MRSEALVLCAGIAALGVAGAVGCRPGAMGGPDSSLIRELRKQFPGGRVLQPRDMDRECGFPEQPGLVRVDINGDGRVDTAVLWVQKRSLHFLILHRESGDRWTLLFNEEVESSVEDGSIVMLSPIPSGRVRGLEADASLRHAAVEVAFCGKSSFVAYEDAGQVRKLWTSD